MFVLVPTSEFTASEKEKLVNEKVIESYSINPLGAHNLYSSLRFIDNGDRFGKEMAVIKNVTE
ncbi:hypothetical protein [Psychrobacillus sp. FSL H8-0510]|uniref:hypothetical protein n=1 Tax=Psychrobacillus sp. FSL H8-0510 TaxID=2921394 RepID=UPI004046FC26